MRADVDRDKLKDRHNRPDAVAKGLELNDASRVQRRGRMMLPAPQVSEQELQQIAKGGGDVDMDPDLAEGGTDATRRLLGDYQTPQRSRAKACFVILELVLHRLIAMFVPCDTHLLVRYKYWKHDR